MSKEAVEYYNKLRNMFIRDLTIDGEVVSADEDDYTCVVKLPNGLELQGVQLKCFRGKTDTLVVIPSIGSDVQMINVGGGWMVISCEKVAKVYLDAEVEVIINKGENKGLVKLTNLVEKLNVIEKDLNNIKKGIGEVIGSPLPIAEPGNGAPSALQKALKTALASWYNSQIQSTTTDDLENPKVKH